MQQSSKLPWQGFHHLALTTQDLDETIKFYRDILGMETSRIMQRQGRHCFIKPGGDSWGLHFFEHPDAIIFSNPEQLSDRFWFVEGSLQHIAFRLSDEDAAMELRQRLTDHEVEMTPINQIDRLKNFLFVDNNGILLEAAWQAE